MAENKRSFLLYTDVHFTVKKLTDEQAGKLFKHILSYVNDENPIMNNKIIDLVFEPIKQALKRDLRKYEIIREKRSLAGKASADKRQQVLTNDECVKHDEHVLTNSTVSVSVSDIVNDNVIVKEEKKKRTDFDFQFCDDKFIPVFMEWVEYKKSRNENYKTQKSLEACYRNLLRLSQNNPDKAKLLIDQAMGNNYQGIFPLKTEGQLTNRANIQGSTKYLNQ
jgi:hypothetical protein